ncbi:hypothetical protein [Streptomyces phage phiScoe10]|nr:hypothetical protein [Streptomyces phage phiScoe10]
MSIVTRKTADAVLAAIREMFPDDAEFTLYDADHEGLSEGSWSIACEGLEDWPHAVTDRIYFHPDEFPEGVYLEPIAGWCLGVYAA